MNGTALATDVTALIAAMLRDPADRVVRAALHDALQESGCTAAQATAQIAGELHAAVIAPIVAETRADIVVANAARRASEAYWLKNRLTYLTRVGIVAVEVHALRGTPPAGTVWVRPATGGKYARSRKDKAGRPLTADEMAAILAGRLARGTA